MELTSGRRGVCGYVHIIGDFPSYTIDCFFRGLFVQFDMTTGRDDRFGHLLNKVVKIDETK